MPRDLLAELEDRKAGRMWWLDIPAPRKGGRHRKRPAPEREALKDSSDEEGDS
jgi:hypothetical protein